MSRIIITHVGTSVLNNKDALPPQLKERGPRTVTDLERETPRWPSNELPAEVSLMCKPIRDYVDRRLRDNISENLKRGQLCAELASLRALQLVEGDEIVLVSSATEVGRVCTLLIRALLLELNPCKTVGDVGLPIVEAADGPIYLRPVEYVPGLEVQATNAAGPFLSNGLPNYCNLALKLFRDAQGTGQELVFNVTGGYKGMIPFAALLASLLESEDATGKPGVRCSLCYLYEAGAELIRVPALPVSFDRADIEKYQTIFEVAKTDGASDEQLARAGVPAVVMERYLEAKSAKGKYHLSALGEIVWALYNGLTAVRRGNV